MNSLSAMKSSLTSRKSRVGFRFHPTDEELIDHFLIRKIHGDHEDDISFPEIKLCDYEPWELPDLIKKESNDEAWFFFSPCDYKYKASLRLNRKTKAGFWKPTGKTRKVVNKCSKKVIGTKKTLVFYKGNNRKSIRTSFILHQYNVVLQSKGKSKFCLYKLKVKTELDEMSSSSSPLDLTVNSSCEESNENKPHLASDCENYIPEMIDDMPELISLEAHDSEYQNLEKHNGMLVFKGNSAAEKYFYDTSTPATFSGTGLQINESGPTCLEVEGPVTFFDELRALSSGIMSPHNSICYDYNWDLCG
ncbi:NAC domain containing protein 62 [Euphorbia peplus]|nr:NAC domain containing protein 62 [Euphorbia peplus]